jgi:hypothetical protein
MRNPGLEPGSLAALEPESSASANSASSAGIELYPRFTIIAYLSMLVKSSIQYSAIPPFPHLVPQELCPGVTEY